MHPPTFRSRFGLTLLGVLPASLFVGLMFATAGFAVHPPVAFIATPLVCDGEVEVESTSWSTRPGESGVSRTLWCVSGGGGKPARDDITFKAMGASFLVYSAIAFFVLQLLALLLKRRLETSFRRVATRRDARGAAAETGLDLPSILSQVAEAVERGEARVTVRNMEVDLRDEGGPAEDEAERTDPAERLARLSKLRDRGLITAAEYEAKRAEILRGL